MSTEHATPSPVAPSAPAALAWFQHPSSEHVLERLSQVDLLRGLPPEEIYALVPRVERVEVPTGQRVFSQGDVGDALYLVEDGQARVLLDDGTDLGRKGPGEVFGEMALLTGEPRTATLLAETALVLWRLRREDFDQVVRASPRLERALWELANKHRAGLELARQDPAAKRAWRGTALRALDARRRALATWQLLMGFGFLLWALISANEAAQWLHGAESERWIALAQLVAGLTVLQGACEAFVLAVERMGARLRWEGFISGTIGSLVATLPEFFVIWFLVRVEPLAAFVTAAVTIYNNAIAFSIYSFFLPKDQKGQFLMPHSLAKAGGEVLIAGSGIALIVGAIMLGLRGVSHKTALAGGDLLFIGAVLMVIYGYYTYTLLRYFSEGGEEDDPNQPPDPERLGHDTSWRAIGSMMALGVAGAYVGGESIGGFADTALNQLGLPTIPTAAALAFFAGISEYIIVWKAHRRGELGIALSNVFGGMTQVMFLLLPFSMMAIAVLGFMSGDPQYSIPITVETTFLMILLFPVFYVLLEYLKDDHTLNNLDAAAMTGIYALLLYFLFTTGSGP
jgi:CRP-like cAMP-binding protein/Ca2+/Na+ antiporter